MLFDNLQSYDFRNNKPYIWNTCHHAKFDWPLSEGVTFDNMEMKVMFNDMRYLGKRTGTHRLGDENTCTISFSSLVV
jgi:hypothetical protein